MKVKSPTALFLAIALTLVAALPAAAMTVIGERGSTAVSFLAPLDVPPAEEPPSGTVRLMSGGDVILAHSVGRRILSNGPLAPWQGVKQYFDQADLVVANLECTISERGTAWNKTFNFRAPPAAVDLACRRRHRCRHRLANNHALDYGRLAFADELALLDAQGVGHVGGGANVDAARAPLISRAQRPAHRVPGLRPAVLRPAALQHPSVGRDGNAERPCHRHARVVTQDVKAAKQAADVVVVMVHGGIELQLQAEQGAEAASTAAAIARRRERWSSAHHPHVLQGYVYESQTVIAYSTGNFVFDMAQRQRGTRHGDPRRDALEHEGVESLAWIPIEIHNGFPRPAIGPEAAGSWAV